MIWLHNAGIGETVGVNSIDGYGEGWAEIEAPPALQGWRYDGTAWVAIVPAFTPDRLWQLLTVPEHVAARTAEDSTGLVAVAFDRINARREPLPLNDGNFVALCLRLVELGVLTQPRAAQVLAGQFPA